MPDPQALDLTLDLNGARMQTGSTSTMIFTVAHLVSYISRFMTLMPGDVITTGTPPGVGMARKPRVFLKVGDELRLTVAGLGEQRLRSWRTLRVWSLMVRTRPSRRVRRRALLTVRRYSSS